MRKALCGPASARDPHTPADILRRLAFETDSDSARMDGEPMPTIRASAAANPSLPEDVRASLTADANPWVRGGIAANPSTGPETLAHLAHDDAEQVRVAVAGNPNTPAEVLVELARDVELDNWTARAVADNPNCPEDLASRLRSTIPPEPEAEPGGSPWSSVPRGLAQAGFGVLVAHQLAKREETPPRRPRYRRARTDVGGPQGSGHGLRVGRPTRQRCGGRAPKEGRRPQRRPSTRRSVVAL